MLVLACTANAASTAGQPQSACPTSQQIWVEPSSPWEQLTYTDASLLLSLAVATWATAWGFRKVLDFIGRP